MSDYTSVTITIYFESIAPRTVSFNYKTFCAIKYNIKPGAIIRVHKHDITRGLNFALTPELYDKYCSPRLEHYRSSHDWQTEHWPHKFIRHTENYSHDILSFKRHDEMLSELSTNPNTSLGSPLKKQHQSVGLVVVGSNPERSTFSTIYR